jgi:outer membrane biosynthesis protein TonB
VADNPQEDDTNDDFMAKRGRPRKIQQTAGAPASKVEPEASMETSAGDSMEEPEDEPLAKQPPKKPVAPQPPKKPQMPPPSPKVPQKPIPEPIAQVQEESSPEPTDEATKAEAALEAAKKAAADNAAMAARQLAAAKQFNEYYNTVLKPLPLIAVANMVVIPNFNGTNLVVMYDKLKRPLQTVQIDFQDLDRLKALLDTLIK